MAVNNRQREGNRIQTGWPLVNYAQEERNFQGPAFEGQDQALSIPRFKFTWLAEFGINERVFENPTTNIRSFTNNGKIYTHLISIDHPKPTITHERLRSYNRWINVPTTVEFPTANMTFHDDSTACVQALWKEHLNFYSHLGQVGDGLIGDAAPSRLRSQAEANSYHFSDSILTGVDTRLKQGERPSLGMRLKASDMRHFFDYIAIYDLGTEPDGINVYWYHRPMITTWDHDALDKEDRTGNVRVSANFEYESYYFTFGQNRGRIADYISQIFEFVSDIAQDAPRKDGIARDVNPVGRNIRKEIGTVGNTQGFNDGVGIRDIAADVALENIRQNAIPGAGFGEASNGALVAASAEEQLASVGGLNSPAQRLKNTLNAAGANTETESLGEATAKTFPLGTREGQDLIASPLEEQALQEPLAPSELRAINPPDIRRKRQDLDQVNALQENPDLTDAQRSKLSNREADLTQAINKQQRVAGRTARLNPATRDALENTQNSTGVDAATPTGSVVNIGTLVNNERWIRAAQRDERQAARYDQLAAQARENSQAFANAGNTEASRQELEKAEAFEASSVESLDNALTKRIAASKSEPFPENRNRKSPSGLVF